MVKNKTGLKGRTWAINTGLTNREPTGMCRINIGPLLIEEEIIEEIFKWTNGDMVEKWVNLKEISVIFKYTNEMETCTVIEILTLAAVMKDNLLRHWTACQ